MLRTNRHPSIAVESITTLSITTLSIVLLLTLSQVGHAASPGPDAAAESKSYDITATSRNNPELTGNFEFVGDPERPQRIESGDFNASLAASADTEATPATGSETWWSRDFRFFGFWLAHAESAETEFRVFSVGLIWSSKLHGTLYVYDGTELAHGAYRLSGAVAAEPVKAADPVAETPATTVK